MRGSITCVRIAAMGLAPVISVPLSATLSHQMSKVLLGQSYLRVLVADVPVQYKCMQSSNNEVKASEATQVSKQEA